MVGVIPDSVLNVRELLGETYDVLSRRHSPAEVSVPLAVPVSHSSSSGVSRGHMLYDRLGLFGFGGRSFVFGQGVGDCGFGSARFDSDFVVSEYFGDCSDRFSMGFANAVKNDQYVGSVAFLGMANGELGTVGGSLGDKLMGVLSGVTFGDYVSRSSSYDRGVVLASSRRHPFVDRIGYSPVFAGVLADSLEGVLS